MFPELSQPPPNHPSHPSTTRSGGCPATQAATPPSHKSQTRSARHRGSAGPRPLASLHGGLQRLSPGERCTLTPRGSTGICPDAQGVALHTPNPVGPSRQVRKAAPARNPPLWRRGSGPSRAGPLSSTPRASPWRRPLPPPRTPLSGLRTPPTAPRGPPPPPEGDSRRSRAEAGPSSSSSSPPEEKKAGGGGGGLLTGRQDMARPATARPPPPPHEAPSQGRRGQRLGRWSVSSGCSSAAAASSQPQQHGGSGHTERAPDAEPAASGGARARSGLQFAVGKRAGCSGLAGGGARVACHAPRVGGASDHRKARGERKVGGESQLE